MTAGRSGSVELTSSSNASFKLRIKWKETYDVEENKSTVKITSIQVKSASYYQWTYYADLIIKLNGVKVIELSDVMGDAYVQVSAQNTWYTLVDATTKAAITAEVSDIVHSSDGSKSISLQLAGNNAASARFRTIYGGGGSPWYVDGVTKTLTLTTIPRASTIGASDANIESVSTVSVTRKSTAYTHSIQYAFGSLKRYLKADGSPSDSEVKLTATSIPFTIPAEFYAQITDAASGECTLTCKTYSGSTQIGAAQTTTFTVTASKSKCAPEVSGSVVDSKEATKALTGDEKVFIRYMSDALCTIAATAKNSATLKAKSIGGVTVSGDTRTISGIDSASVKFYARDSRGYSTTVTKTLEMVPYIRLTGVLTAGRTDPTSGKATLSVKGNYYNGSFGARENSLTVRYKVGSGDYVLMEPALDGNSYTAEAALTGLDYQSSHKITVQVTDALETVTKTVTIGKGIPVFDWGEEDIAFQVDVRLEKDLRVEGAAAVGGDMTVSGSLTVGGKSLLDLIYPVGSIYMSVSATSPATLFGGTWSQLKDRFLLGAGSTYTAEATGGSATHTLTVEEMPSHAHKLTMASAANADSGCNTQQLRIHSPGTTYENTNPIASAGGGEAHNNMPPYLAVYMWKRTA